MEALFLFQGEEFEWDAEKAQSNLDKHGVNFEEAVEAFFDPFYQYGNASTPEEQRDFIIGYTGALRLLLVVYTEQGERTRIISARPATRAERNLYESA